MKIEEVIGERVREAREAAGWTQQELGGRLERYLGRTWSRQAVSAAEKGDRAFTAAELIAFAATFNVQMAQLFTPTETDSVEMPSGSPFYAGSLLALFMRDDAIAVDAIVGGLERAVGQVDEYAAAIRQQADVARQYLTVASSQIAPSEQEEA